MSGMRFTSWLSGDERDALRTLAAKLGCSENFIVRMALRALLFDKPVPEYMRGGNASNTSNTTQAHTTGARE